MSNLHADISAARAASAICNLQPAAPAGGARDVIANAHGPRFWTGLIVVALAVGLTVLFWRPLWTGGGLIGGDTYSYYFPQKAFYADQLQSGDVPLWNPLVGHGYPVVAESQTGVFYPPNLLLYRLLDVNSAYNASHLLHYVLAFLATWLLARRMGLGAPGAALCAIVFVYGWFPPRVCLEWAIIGGVYIPWCAWCVESYLQAGRLRYLLGVSAGLAVFLLAGHFNLAFITVATIAAYAPLRVWLAGEEEDCKRQIGGAPKRKSAICTRALRPLAQPVQFAICNRRCFSTTAAVLGAILLGFALAAIQLLPTWELKQLSQRSAVGDAHDPGYGHIPPLYFSQVFAPWWWYAPEVDADQALERLTWLAIPSRTNKVEAHLYFGLVPLVMTLWGVQGALRRRRKLPAPLVIWLLLGLASAVYATGWLLPLAGRLPGFSFFMGPGRWGIVTTLSVALVSGFVMDGGLAACRSRWARGALFLIAAGATTGDLWTVSHWWMTNERRIYAVMVPDPPIAHRGESDVRRILAGYGQPVRLYAPGPNLATLTGFAATPTYLGLSPAQYYDPQLKLPRPEHDPPASDEVARQVSWLRRAGVTHILSERPLEPASWPVQLVWQGFDRLLNPAWARRDPLYLYELLGSRGRVAWVGESPAGEAAVTQYRPERIEISVDTGRPGTLVLTDLAYPGWRAEIDGVQAAVLTVDEMYCGIDVPAGRHRVVWTYRPTSLRLGLLVSAGSVLVLLAATAWRRWRPRRTPS